MKNLKLYSELSSKLELNSKEEGQEEILLLSAFDIERSRLFFASSANRIYTTHLSSFQVCPCSVLRCLFHLNYNIV
jgi:elongator complex protein 1